MKILIIFVLTSVTTSLCQNAVADKLSAMLLSLIQLLFFGVIWGVTLSVLSWESSLAAGLSMIIFFALTLNIVLDLFPVSTKDIRNIYIFISLVLQIFIYSNVFGLTEWVVYAPIFGNAVGLMSIYYWRSQGLKKEKNTKLDPSEKGGVAEVG